MTAVLNFAKYAVIDTPVDYAKFALGDFSPSEIKNTKNLVDRVKKVLTSLDFFHAWGYSSATSKAVAEQCKAFKNIHSSVEFLANVRDGALDITKGLDETKSPKDYILKLASNVANFAKDIFSGLLTFLRYIDKLSIGVSALMLKRLGQIADVKGTLESVKGLYSSVVDLSKEVVADSNDKKYLKVLASVYNLGQKITLTAMAILSLAASVLAPVVALPAVPLYVVPTLAMTSTVLGSFNKYVESHI